MKKNSTWVLAALLVTASLSGFGQACTKTLTATEVYSAISGDVVCIASGVTYTGTLTIGQNNVTVRNSGTVTGTIQVNSSVSGTVINNLSSIATDNLNLYSATALNNGSSSVSSATWSGYLGPGRVTVAPTISNYGTWTVQGQPLPGATITNQSTGTWNGYLTTSAALTVTNAGTWQSQIQESSGSPTITITHSAGTWTGALGGGSGSLRITANAAWIKGFNFPSGGSNNFTLASGITANFDSYLGLSGTITLVNNGTMNLTSGMAALPSGSSLTTGAGSTFNLGSTDLTNNGTILNRGTISSNNFTNNGTITGPPALPRGRFNASNYTVNSGNFGADGSYLDFCDSTPPTPASNGFDSRGGTIGANVTYCAPITPLPVVLARFAAQRQAAHVVLTWLTASELDNDYFEAERSADGHQFAAFARVAGQGSKPTATTYTTTDAAPRPGPTYYRLRQVNRDGTAAYSPVVSVAAAETVRLPAYPNPTAGPLTLDLSTLPETPVAVTVSDLLGRPVLMATLPGGQPHPLPLAGLPIGTYLLHLRAAGHLLATQRICKQ